MEVASSAYRCAPPQIFTERNPYKKGSNTVIHSFHKLSSYIYFSFIVNY